MPKRPAASSTQTFTPNAASPQTGKRPRVALWVLAITAATAIPYLPSLLNGGFTLDDWAIVYRDPLAHSLANAPKAFLTDFLRGSLGPDISYYRPLVTVTFQANWAMAGPNPFVFRLTNLLLGILCALLVFCLARRVTKSALAAGLAGVSFAVAPSHAEAVAWIAGRTDLMSCLFVLAGTLTFAAAYDARPRIHWPLALATSFLFLCGMFSKENALTLPIIALGYALIVGGGIRWKEALKWVAVFAVPFAVYMVVHRIAVDVTVVRHAGFLLGKRLLGIGIAYAAYMRMLFLPTTGRVIYDVFPIGIKYPVIAIAAWMIPVGLGAASAILRKKLPAIAFAAFWILIAIVPVSNLLPTVGPLPADRFVFLASVGSSIVLGWLGEKALRWRREGMLTSRLLGKALVVWFILYCGAQTVLSSRNYLNDLAWAEAVAQADCRFLRACSGYHFWKAGMYEEAIREYNASIRLEPDQLSAYTDLAKIRHELGQPAKALETMLLAKDRFPPRAAIEYHLGIAYAQNGELKEAAEAFARAVKLQPRHWRAWRNLGKANLKLRHYADAVRAYEKGFSIHDLGPASRVDLGRAYVGLGHHDKARREFKRALSEDPQGPAGKAARTALATGFGL
jgi:hypothetical protein